MRLGYGGGGGGRVSVSAVGHANLTPGSPPTHTLAGNAVNRRYDAAAKKVAELQQRPDFDPQELQAAQRELEAVQDVRKRIRDGGVKGGE